VKYLNIGIESDHAPIKKLVVGTNGFRVRKRAWSIIQEFESHGCWIKVNLISGCVMMDVKR
jgi:transposase-like protein